MLVGVPGEALVIHGDTTTYVDHGDSGGTVQRQFCGTCGSPLFSRPEVMPAMVFIKAGTLDDTADFVPSAQFYLKSKQAWVDLAGIPGFDTVPG